MIEIKYFLGLEEAFDRVMVKDVDHVLIRHSYVKGTKIYPHIHHDAAEWVIASKGHFKVSSMEEEETFNLKGEDVVTIYYPAGREHALSVLGERLDYFVLRKPS